jgi:hypothetical protein
VAPISDLISVDGTDFRFYLAKRHSRGAILDTKVVAFS